MFSCIILFMSCDKIDNVCEKEKPTTTFLIDYPDTVSINQQFIAEASYLLESSCGEFERFDGLLVGNLLTVKLIVKYKGCACEQKFLKKTINYPITFTEVGTYELRFWIAEGEYESNYIHVIE